MRLIRQIDAARLSTNSTTVVDFRFTTIALRHSIFSYNPRHFERIRMIDPGTGLTVLGGALGGAKVVEKILGPTADYLGAGAKDWTERGLKNLTRVFDKAKNRLGENIETPGAVPPKVLRGLLAEGPFCDDELSAEYFGGVLASSRSEIGRDDRGVTFTSLLGRLSSYQVRAHFFFYSVIETLYRGSSENIASMEGRVRLRTFVPMPAFLSAMEFGKGENINNILPHVMFGLSREFLIENQFQFGGLDHLRGVYAKADVPGILFVPSPLGVELFLWAHGRPDLSINDLLNPNVSFTSEVAINVTPGIRSTEFADRAL
jgi:hypothetical protein